MIKIASFCTQIAPFACTWIVNIAQIGIIMEILRHHPMIVLSVANVVYKRA